MAIACTLKSKVALCIVFCSVCLLIYIGVYSTDEIFTKMHQVPQIPSQRPVVSERTVIKQLNYSEEYLLNLTNYVHWNEDLLLNSFHIPDKPYKVRKKKKIHKATFNSSIWETGQLDRINYKNFFMFVSSVIFKFNLIIIHANKILS